MIVLTVDFTVRPDHRKELLQTIHSLFERGGAETGRFSRHLYRDAENGDRFLLREEWLTEEDLRCYLNGELFGVLLGALNLLGSSRKLRLDRMSVVSDEAGVIAMRKHRPQRSNA